MSELRPVRSSGSLIDRHLAGLTTLIVLAILIAIAKPWDWYSGRGADQARESGGPTGGVPRASPVTAPRVGFQDLVYDASIFGTHEPPPVWGLWPAAYLVTFGFVFQVPDLQAPAPASTGGPPASPAGSLAPTISAGSSPGRTLAPPPDGGPSWPSGFTSPAGYHLFLIGVDMPNGFSLSSASLTRIVAPGAEESVPLKLLDSPWPAHFAVVGIPGPAGSNHLSVWPPGTYRLALVFDPNAVVRRTLDITVTAPPRA